MRYFYRHWAGQHSLARSFGLNLAVPVVLLYFLDDALDLALRLVPDTPLVIQTWLLTLSALLLLLLWGLTGVWKSATREFRLTKSAGPAEGAGPAKGARGQRLLRWGFAEAAQVCVFVLAWFYTFSIAVFLPTYSTLLQIAGGQDPLSTYVLDWGDEDKTWIYFGGTIGFGLNEDLQALLRQPNNATYIQLESDGGRELEAEKVARTIEGAGLSTYTQTQCVSACTLMFLAGQDRTLDLEDGARIGFHSPYLQTMMGEANVEGLTEQYAQHLMDRNVSEAFADWAVRVAPDDMWFPTPQILKEEGIVTQFYVDEEAGAVPVDAFSFEDQFYTLDEAEVIFRQVDAATRNIDDLQNVIDINQRALKTGWLSALNQTNAHFRIGISHRFLNQYDAAILAFREADKIRADYTPVLYQRALTYGDWYEASGEPIRLRQAINDLSRLILMEPDNGEAYSTRAMYHVEAKELDAAEADFDQSVALAPFNSAIANNSCWFKITALGQFDTALADCDRALALAPDSDAALHSRALTHDILGNRDLALADYRQAYALAPERQEISRQSIAYLEAGSQNIEAVTQITGVWAEEPVQGQDPQANSCADTALRISVDVGAATYRAVHVGTGEVQRAKLLDADGNRFHIQYTDEKEEQGDGVLVSWHLVMLSADSFFWVRDDAFIRVADRLVFQGNNSGIRSRCASVS